MSKSDTFSLSSVHADTDVEFDGISRDQPQPMGIEHTFSTYLNEVEKKQRNGSEPTGSRACCATRIFNLQQGHTSSSGSSGGDDNFFGGGESVGGNDLCCNERIVDLMLDVRYIPKFCISDVIVPSNQVSLTRRLFSSSGLTALFFFCDSRHQHR